ncbi:MAG: HDOD domain-containing protein [Nitrosomonadales bacterium]|nr:HDOD domain-containing protein [Nitrosomonadales bacterium]
MSEVKDLEYWASMLSHADLPVLKQTARELAALREDDKRLTAISVAEVIARDPIMTVKLLRYLQRHKRKIQKTEIVQIDQALLMLGLGTFFNKIPPDPLAEDMLQPHLEALHRMLRVVHRSHRASEYAKDWAVILRDLHYEEVRVAALLHDFTEILMWCFAPDSMLEIREIRHKDPALRSQSAQELVFGFNLYELQKILIVQWGLPQLLFTLMNDYGSDNPRVRNVVLAANLARHSARGWDDAALPDDYKDIGELLRMPAEDVMEMIYVDAGLVCDINQTHR